MQGKCAAGPTPDGAHAGGDGGADVGALDARGDTGDAGQPPRITGINGEGTTAGVVDTSDGGLPDAAIINATRRFQTKWEVSGEFLDTVTSAKLEKTGGGATFTAAEGLVFEQGGTAMKRNLLLPAALVTGAFTLTITNPSGDATAEVYVLQGEPGPKGDQGLQGLQGEKGDTGAAGQNVTLASEAPGANCANGGIKVTSASGDEYVCDGAQGQQGLQGVAGVSVTGEVEASGANCANGGVKYTSTSGTNYVCKGDKGDTGATGTFSGTFIGDVTFTGNLSLSGNLSVGGAISAPCVYFDGGYACNCSLTFSTWTLKISGESGPLSATNKCVVGMNDASGIASPMEFTADVTATFGAPSDTDENRFGISDADWLDPMPMFLHLCDGATAPYFSFSRNPARISSGAAAANICQKGDTNCIAQGDMFIMASGLTLANEVNRPCVTVGSFQAHYTFAGHAWVVETLVPGRDGFGVFQEGEQFVFPTGQMGAASATYVNGAGTAPTYTHTNTRYLYSTYRDGTCHVWFNLYNSTGGTAGSGGAALEVAIPYAIQAIDSYNRLVGSGAFYENAGTIQYDCVLMPVGLAGISKIQFWYGAAGTGIVLNDQSSVERQIYASFQYNPF